jgi:hypothetical protein
MSPFSLDLDPTTADYHMGAELALELFTAALTAPGLAIEPDATPPPETWRVRYRPILLDLLAGDELPAAATARLSAFMFAAGELHRIAVLAYSDERAADTPRAEMTTVIVRAFRDLYLTS